LRIKYTLIVGIFLRNYGDSKMAEFIYNDGGRADAGYKGTAGDCGVRALAIVTNSDYKEIYKMLAQANKNFGFAKSARNGIQRNVYEPVLNQLGWHWVSAPKFIGRKARCSDLKGRVIALQAGHYVAVIDGVPNDIFDCSNRMVYGYWEKGE